MKAEKIETIERYYIETADHLTAMITFSNKVFNHCTFNFGNDYTFRQWMFLRDVGNEIERIKKKMEEA